MYEIMACTEQDFIDSIIRQFASGSPCDDSLADTIPALWELTAREACGSVRLHNYLARRETVLFLMGCEAYSVDTYDRHRNMDASTVFDAASDLRTQAQATGNSTRFSTGHGETRYDEYSKARSQGNMDRHARATETGDGASFYRDDGRGNGFNNSASTNEIEAVDTALTQNRVTAASRETGSRRDCNYELSQSNTCGVADGAPPLASASVSATAHEWRKYTKTTAGDQDSAQRMTTHLFLRDVRDERTGSGTHNWLSQFQADIFWRDHDFEIKISHDRTDTRRHAEAHAQGDGDGFSEAKDEAHNAAQGTAKSDFKGNSKRTFRRAESQTLIALANSQRFRNLQLIYDQLTDQIAFWRRATQQRFPSIGSLPCNCNGCCRCGASFREFGHASYTSIAA